MHLILHIVSGLFYGGGQQVALDLVRTLRRERGLAAQLCILGDRSAMMAAEADHAVAFDGRYNRMSSLVVTGMRLRRVLKATRPRIIHTHGWDASMIGAIARMGTDVAQVTHWHTTDEWLNSRALKHVARRRLTHLMLTGQRKRIVAVSAASRDHLCEAMGWPRDAVQVLHNGIDTARFHPAKNGGSSGEPLVIGTVSRIAAGKGLQFLIAAIGMLDEHQRRNVRLKLAGEGNYRSDLERQVSELGLESVVEFVGHVEPAEFYRTLDVFVLPSLSEGLPLCVLEAMASGCPTIATAVGGVPEIISDGVDGLLVPPGDSGSLQSAIERLLADRQLRHRLAAGCVDRVRSHFALSGVAADVATIYRGFDKASCSSVASAHPAGKSVGMKVLLVRLDHAGDVVLTVPPAAARLRRAWPECRIEVLTTRTGESLLRDDPHIDRIIAWDAPWSVPPPGLRYVPRTVFIRRVMQFGGMVLRRQVGRYDAIVYLSFSPWERVLTRMLSRRRLGFKGPYTRPAHVRSERLLTDGWRFDESRHIVENCDELLSLLGIGGGAEPTKLYLDEPTKRDAAGKLAEIADDASDIVLVHPGSPKSFKSWPHEYFVQTAEELADRAGMTCVIVASQHETADFLQKYGRSAHPQVRYTTARDLREFAAMASNAKLTIANDGGPCHIAAAVGRPLIAVFGPTNESIYGPQGADVRVLRQPHPAAPCNTPWQVKSTCCGGRECLRGLAPGTVVQAALQMLQVQHADHSAAVADPQIVLR